MPKQKRSTQTNFTWDPGHANEKQLLFYQSRTMYTAYGGARGGGKTHAVRIKAVGGAFTWPGIRILIVRKTYPELQSNHIEPILKMVPQELTSYNGTLHTLYFQNGSTIHFGHWSGITSESEYQGQEYDWIFMDEATQFTEREFRFLGGCLRGVNEIPKRFYLTCNPGGVGHRWVKRLFIDRNFKTDSDNPEENENPDDYSFIFATVEDNKDLLESSPGYLQALSQLPENIRKAHRYGDWDATDDECIAAAKLANADHFIRMLPDGYNTVLKGDGSGLSQGQRQLLSIARAAVSDPPVMILDEATSSIDTRTEALVQSGMDKLMEGRTVFVIAHRLSTVKNADVIMVLDHGRIIERGNHAKLIAEKGVYYQLYTGAFELE